MLTPDDVLALQGRAGNQAVVQLVQSRRRRMLSVQRQGRRPIECSEAFHPEPGRVVDPVLAKAPLFFVSPYQRAEAGHLAHLYFRTARFHFPIMAEQGANRLIAYMIRHPQRPLHLRFIGYADWRAGCEFNDGLARARARSVAGYFRERLEPSYGSDFTYETMSLGEQLSSQQDLAEHRRVDVRYFGFAPPRHDFEEEPVPGRVPDRFSRDFEFRVVAGAEGGAIGGLLWIDFEIRNLQGGQVDRLVYRGFVMKLSRPGPFGGPVLPSGPHTVRTDSRLELSDFVGRGSVYRLSVGNRNGEMILYFYGPKDRGRTEGPVVITLPGGRIPGASFSRGKWSSE